VNLSYGDQRRLEIARALASDPKLLLLDEPTAGMNPQETADLTRLIRRIRDERGITGLETAIILIAFVVVATVFAFIFLTTGEEPFE
jgi:flagellin-like protein